VASLRICTLVVMAATALGAQARWVEQVTIDGDPVLRGLPKDAIPAIDNPVFVPADRASFVHPDEPVIGIAVDDEARAYPTWLLNAHEIVNDRIGGRAIAVTW
jgi:hypothetical protein